MFLSKKARPPPPKGPSGGAPHPGQDQPAHLLQGLKDPLALGGHRLKDGEAPLGVHHGPHHVHGQGVGQVPLVDLEHHREVLHLEAVLRQVFPHVAHALGVGPEAVGGRVGHKDDAVHTPQDQLAAGVVKDLAGDGVEVEAGLEALHLPQVQRQEVKEEGALVLGGQGDHLSLAPLRDPAVNPLEVGGLPRKPGAIVDDLEVDLAIGEVDGAHASCRKARPKGPWPLPGTPCPG